MDVHDFSIYRKVSYVSELMQGGSPAHLSLARTRLLSLLSWTGEEESEKAGYSLQKQSGEDSLGVRRGGRELGEEIFNFKF